MCRKSFAFSPNFEIQPDLDPIGAVAQRGRLRWLSVIRTDVLRPGRFLFTHSEDPDQAEIDFLKNTNVPRNREDLELFIRLAGIENVPSYFNWGRVDIQYHLRHGFDDVDRFGVLNHFRLVLILFYEQSPSFEEKICWKVK